jgi:hypothetical protein
MNYKTVQDVWDNPNRRYPTIAYIETTNYCNAKCLCCPNDICEKPRGIMTFDTFMLIADKLKTRGVPIGAMFCFGEPFIDPSLLQKCEYANLIKAYTPNHIGFNTNVSLIKPEHYEGIMKNTSNITLSFYNVGKEYNRLTGNLDWETCYNIAIDMIKYRDKYYPKFEIFIGTNKIDGFNQSEVQKAFEGYNVRWAHDANIKYGKRRMLTGVIDRTIMYNWWTCDGHKGAIQIKWNGDCEYCAYDIIGDSKGGKTRFANILTDSWVDIEAKFKAKWKSGSDLCKQCDYWHRYNAIKENNCKRPNPLPKDWYDWQKPYLKEGDDYIE